jgi:hypothetical protein
MTTTAVQPRPRPRTPSEATSHPCSWPSGRMALRVGSKSVDWLKTTRLPFPARVKDEAVTTGSSLPGGRGEFRGRDKQGRTAATRLSWPSIRQERKRRRPGTRAVPAVASPSARSVGERFSCSPFMTMKKLLVLERFPGDADACFVKWPRKRFWTARQRSRRRSPKKAFDT